ncbi:MAG: Salinibacter virus, partial [Bacteroidota bacterium]
MKNLANKLVKVIGSVSGKVSKSGYNSHQKYNYVMESDLLDAVREEVVNHGLLITYSVEDVKREGEITTVKIKHLIVDAESGESLEVYSVGQGADKMDKGVYKAI